MGLKVRAVEAVFPSHVFTAFQTFERHVFLGRSGTVAKPTLSQRAQSKPSEDGGLKPGSWKLKIPTERSDRVARAKDFYEKALAAEKDKIDPKKLTRYWPDQVASGLADYAVDSKPGTYTVSVTLKDPGTGADLSR